MKRNDVVIQRPFNEAVQLELMAARLDAMLGELGLRPMGGGDGDSARSDGEFRLDRVAHLCDP